jgi:1-acyl-sn-glycerol-3-phosphate acyltransferase
VFLPVVLINIPQIFSLIVRIFSVRSFRQINHFFADRYWAYLVFMVETVNSIDVEITGDHLPSNENAMLLPNHQNIADIPVLLSIAKRKNRLGDMKWFMKSIIKYIPGPGWGMLFLDGIFLRRNWADDRENIENTFARIKRYNVPIWLVSFLEGTRVTESKLELSRKFAAKRQLPQPRHLMIPRTKGFLATMTGLRDHLDAVYDVTIAYPTGIPSLWQMIQGDVKKVCIHIRRYPLELLPKNDQGLEDWVYRLFSEKDELLEHFQASKSFQNSAKAKD